MIFSVPSVPCELSAVPVRHSLSGFAIIDLGWEPWHVALRKASTAERYAARRQPCRFTDLITYDAILDRLAGPRVAPPADGSLPWWKPEPPEDLGEKPYEGYGYLEGNKLYVVTHAQLVQRLAQVPGTAAVWTPETAALARPEDVPSLHADVHQHVRQGVRKHAIRAALLTAAMVVVMVVLWLAWDVGFRTIFAVIGVFAAVETLTAVHQLRGTRTFDPMSFPRAREGGRHAAWLLAQPVPHSRWLAGCIIAVAVVGFFADERALAVAGLVKDRVWAEPFRLLTAAMLHVSFLHAWFNVPALFWIGRMVEVHTPRARVGLVFLVSALGGTLLSAAVDPRTSVGASGGILGMVGYLVVMAHRRPEELPEGYGRTLRSVIVGTAALGILGVAFIDNAAHLGGFVAGMALGRVLTGYDVGHEPRWLRAAGWAALAVLTATALATILLIFFDPLGSAAALEP